MVLVCYIPNKDISILQTKFSDRERHEARRGGLEAMPLDQDIESGHGEREVAYLLGADNSIGPLLSHLRGAQQLVVRPRNAFSAPRSHLLARL